jgi:hypothetical protein
MEHQQRSLHKCRHQAAPGRLGTSCCERFRVGSTKELVGYSRAHEDTL